MNPAPATIGVGAAFNSTNYETIKARESAITMSVDIGNRGYNPTMARECAFCPETANRSREHLWSNWISQLLPGQKRLTFGSENPNITTKWVSPELNWKAKVVCGRCNNQWMSDIENAHAKPAMTDLILGRSGIPIDQSRASSIAIFAFKTAVIFDHISRNRRPFFERSARHEFRNSLTIPSNVSMWLTKFVPSGSGGANTLYHEGGITPDKSLEVYVCNYAVEHLVIQIVAYKERGLRTVSVKDNFLAVPFWPKVPEAFIWPPASVLKTASDFHSFCGRWQDVVATF
jgi:hypothetical protein